jgi:hypothetical protein
MNYDARWTLKVVVFFGRKSSRSRTAGEGPCLVE